jgi:cyclopropane-fatty-acyl-phospholipid synthase
MPRGVVLRKHDMFWKKRLDAVIAGLCQKYSLPLRVILWNGTQYDLGKPPTVIMRILRKSALRYVLAPSLDNLAKAYIEKEIDVEGRLQDIIQVATQLAENAWYKPGRHKIRYRFFSHTKQTDAAAIQYHYDVSNAFYQLWLDENMVYSCAYFGSGQESLEEAQHHKLDHILRKIQLKPGEKLLDIGCGWGALIMHAAKHYGATALGITLSRNQYEFAQARIAQAGLKERCEVRLMDYRDLEGEFDKITSVGMFEHVGLKNLPLYFNKMHRLLKDGGLVLNHGITSTDPESGSTSLGASDFISQYVFPHGELPHISLVLKTLSAAKLEGVDIESLRRHYALTLEHWAQRFEAHGDEIRHLAGEKHYRIWRIYLQGCAHAFQQNWVSIYQVLACKAGGPGLNPLPLTREYMYPHS